MLFASNNLWECDENNDAWRALGEDCSAAARVPGLAQAYREMLPDVLALQEVSVLMQELLTAELARLCREGRLPPYALITGGFTPVLYRRDRLRLLEAGYYCYPVAVPGLEGRFNDGRSKSFAYGVFEPQGGGASFAFMSTHLWWKSADPARKSYLAGSDTARAWQLRLNIRKMEEVTARYGCPGVIAGDFNDKAGSPCLDAAAASGWLDAHDLAAGSRDETSGHHYCFPDGFYRGEPGTFAESIDHIIVKDLPSGAVRGFTRFAPVWFDKLSDHYPLCADIAL